METKRIEKIITNKENTLEFLNEVLVKSNLIYQNEMKVMLMPSFLSVLKKIETIFENNLSLTGHTFVKTNDIKMMKNYLLTNNEYSKLCCFKQNYENINKDLFVLEGVSILETEYLAKGEILELIDLIEKVARDELSLPLYSGKDVISNNDTVESYSIYSFINGDGVVKVCEINYYGQCKNNGYLVTFSLNANLLLAMIYAFSNNDGLMLPSKIVSKNIVILPKNKAKIGVMDLCKDIQEELQGFNVFLDDSLVNLGYKNIKYDLEGVAIKVLVQTVENENKIFLIDKFNKEKKEVTKENLVKEVTKLLKRYDKSLYKNVCVENAVNSKIVLSKQEFNPLGINMLPWCGNLSCLNIADDEVCFIPFHQVLALRKCAFCEQNNHIYINLAKISKKM